MILNLLKNKHLDSDIYVLASGASLGHIDGSFFNNKVVVAINHTVEYINECQQLYLIAKDLRPCMQETTKNKNGIIVCTKFHGGLIECGENEILYPEITAIFNPKKGAILEDDDQCLEHDYSTVISAIHLAVYLGAKNIVLVGHDCGTLDGELHVKNYNNYSSKYGVKTGIDYENWMSKKATESRTIQYKEKIKELFNVNIYSLNPFINFNLERHVYASFNSYSIKPPVEKEVPKEQDEIEKTVNRKIKKLNHKRDTFNRHA